MSVNTTSDESTTTTTTTTMARKRPYEWEESDDVKRREREHTEIRFDFIVEKPTEDGDVSGLLEKLVTIKQQLNEVKSLLSDKDIADWNRHTAYMNTASTIVPYLREKLNIEIGTQAWAKMFEILANFPLINHLDNQKWTTLHLCEAPGGFISALNHFLVTREENQKIEWQWFAETLNPYYEHDQFTASMLIDDDRLIFHTIDDNHWDFGMDNSGNLMHQANIEHYISRFQPMGISLVTADGSFDVQNNPGEQEHLVYPLLKTEVYVALSCLIPHGHFVLKIFTLFEQRTVDLIYLLYRTFRQISMFKPKTSKKGNSETYVICLDFNRANFTDCFSADLEIRPVSHSTLFLDQLFQCAQLFQTYQINTIEHNLAYFDNLNRRFVKKLHRIKESTLDAFLNQCQVRQLLSTDRCLLKVDLPWKRVYQNNQRITRTGTFNSQHQIVMQRIQTQIQNGFFCCVCSNNDNHDLCDPCQAICQIMADRSLIMPHIFIGRLMVDKPILIDCVFGQQSSNIRNSCFCNRYLLELCGDIDLSTNLLNEDTIDLTSIRNSSSVEICKEQLEQLQRFTSNYQIQLQSQDGVYYIQSTPILTRLQASVIYVLTRTFQQTSVYVIPSSSSPYLLFLFETFQKTINEEYQTTHQQIFSSSNATLLQFVHIHQLLDQQFAFNLIQANNICLQLKYVTSNCSSQLEINC